MNIEGIHHVSAVAAEPQRNIDFYSSVLGLRLIKQTVDFDEPHIYHFYYGDDLGTPGTVMTFFPWIGAAQGRRGVGQVTATSFSIPETALDYWSERLRAKGIEVAEPKLRFGERYLAFEDPDGLLLELVAHPDAVKRAGWTQGPVPAEHTILGFHTVTLAMAQPEPTATILSDVLGFRQIGQEDRRSRYSIGEGGPGALVDLVWLPGLDRGEVSVGTVHHVAWRVADDAQQQAARQELLAYGAKVTTVQDRKYFHSIYYREPNGILFEIATDGPGFTVDETPDRLGTRLQLPPWLEPRRAEIEQGLPPVSLNSKV